MNDFRHDKPRKGNRLIQLLLKVMHGDATMDEVAKNVACPRPSCRHVDVRLTLIKKEDSSGFVGGMP